MTEREAEEKNLICRAISAYWKQMSVTPHLINEREPCFSKSLISTYKDKIHILLKDQFGVTFVVYRVLNKGALKHLIRPPKTFLESDKKTSDFELKEIANSNKLRNANNKTDSN